MLFKDNNMHSIATHDIDFYLLFSMCSPTFNVGGNRT